MARIPSPPNLGQKQSFLGWLLEKVLRLVIGTWLICQVIGFAFWSIWHLMSHGAREFMFRDFINLWLNHSWRLPEWVGWIPTWQTPWVWVLLALLALWWYWPRVKNRLRSTPVYSDPQGSRGSAYDRSDHHEDLHDDGAFGFKSWKWKKPSDSRALDPLRKFKTRYEDALDLFDLSEPFTMAELKKSYATLAKETHPDSGGNAALFRQVNKAFELLKKKAQK